MSKPWQLRQFAQNASSADISIGRILVEQTMNFDAFSGNRRSRRQTSMDHAPALVESLETRSLLAAAGPSIISPTGTIQASQPNVSWTSVPNAVSYDLWVSDMETRERIIFREGIMGTTTKLTAPESLHMGMNRMWVRATLANGTKTEWGAATTVFLNSRPVVTGPTNPLNLVSPRNIENTDWAVTWNSPDGASEFEVFVSNQTTQTSQTYTVPNLVPAIDARGAVLRDGAGNIVEQEVRSLFLDGAIPVVGAAPQAVSQVVNRSFVEITSDNHGLKNGDRVRVSGVLGNTAANGDFTVVLVSENVFRLSGAVSNGTYTSGGRWVRLASGVAMPGATLRPVLGVATTSSIDITVPNHGLKTGEQVRITGVEGNTAANGTYFVNVLSANVIQLRGVAGNDIYTQGGEVTRLTRFRSTLEIGNYRIFVRTKDDASRLTRWSVAYDFSMTPKVAIRGPHGPTFESMPLLEWSAVPGATHYQVEVFRTGDGTPLYAADYLTTTSYRIPDALTTDPVQNFVFRVRALKLHQVSRMTVSGSPVTGSFRITLQTSGDAPVTVTTGTISYDATAAQVKTAINALDGFEHVDVVSQGIAPNVTFLLQIPLTGNAGNPQVIGGNPVTVSVSETVEPGTVTASRFIAPRVNGEWSPLTEFSTLVAPVITGPFGIENSNPSDTTRIITDLRPTLTWTAIDKTARYEIWVERSASTSTYLRTTSPVNSYKFATDLLPGRYTVKVRAVSSTGQLTAWSSEFLFTATGGVPVVSTVTVTPTRLATVQWAAVAEAASYEIQIARIGVDFNYLNPTNILTTSYTTPVLPTGSYRVWVRAVKADGTLLGWSSPMNFPVTQTADPASKIAVGPELLVLASGLESTIENSEVVAAAASAAQQKQATLAAAVAEEGPVQKVSAVFSLIAVSAQSESGMAQQTLESEQLIQKLAEGCIQQEWWTAVETSAS